MTNNPIAVVMADLHFNINNIDVASTALSVAIDKANDLGVTLIIAGDLHDTKAIIRAEVSNRLLELFSKANDKPIILIGNHDLINEKSSDHALNFLSVGCTVISGVCHTNGISFIPYQSDPKKFINTVNTLDTRNIVICHQGFKGASMGDYVKDESSVDPMLLKSYKFISGHYHKHQILGNVTYVGSPYTVSYGEANDGPKGFLILFEDGTFDQEVISVRKHLIIEYKPEEGPIKIKKGQIRKDDLIWVKVFGPMSVIQKVKREDLIKDVFHGINIKLSYHSSPHNCKHIVNHQEDKLTHGELLDKIIDNSEETEERKTDLKATWRKLI